jgi:hypothetical protein
MVSGRLHPGYDYLVCRKLSSLWHELTGSSLEPDLNQFIFAALELGFTQRVASAIGSQIIARLLIQTGRHLGDLRESDLQELLDACRVRETRTGRGAKHYRSTTHSARQILFHLGILDAETPPAVTALTLQERMADAPHHCGPPSWLTCSANAQPAGPRRSVASPPGWRTSAAISPSRTPP